MSICNPIFTIIIILLLLLLLCCTLMRIKITISKYTAIIDSVELLIHKGVFTGACSVTLSYVLVFLVPVCIIMHLDVSVCLL